MTARAARGTGVLGAAFLWLASAVALAQPAPAASGTFTMFEAGLSVPLYG